MNAFFMNAEMRDVLDSITLLVRGLPVQLDRVKKEWIGFCARAMREEGLAYRVDSEGGVHYFIDTAFAELGDAAVSALSGGPFSAAGQAIAKGIGHLTRKVPDPKSAIRDVFEGVETAFKVRIASGKALTASNASSELRAVISKAYGGGDLVALGASEQTVESLKDWVNACHKYRHGHETEEPVDPPLELAIVLVGNGIDFARWIGKLPS